MAANFGAYGRDNNLHTAQSRLVRQPLVALSRIGPGLSIDSARPARRQSTRIAGAGPSTVAQQQQRLRADDRAAIRHLPGHGSRSVVSYSKCSKVCAANVMTAVFHPADTMMRNSAILHLASRFLLNTAVS